MSHPKRWVLDTNLLISRLLVPSGSAAKAVDHALASGVLMVSEQSMQELAEVLFRPKFDRYIATEVRQQFIAHLARLARMKTITRQFEVCRDPKDNHFLELAFCSQAHAIVTGDQDLLVLHPFHGIPIVSPTDFLLRF